MNFLRSMDRLWRRVRGRPAEDHEQQLMRLYWNRAELKKELSALQEQRQALQTKVDAHQGAVRRASEQLDELAAYLGRPEVGMQGLAYFQLRALWTTCAKKLARFAADLRDQQEERERTVHVTECQGNRDAQVAALHERLLNAQSIADSLDARLKLLDRKIGSLKWIWHYWQRREVRAEAAQVRAQWEIAATNVTDLADEHATLAAAPLTEFPGLSVDGKRVVNTAAIAYSEWLISCLPQRALAPVARNAISVQIFDANLGTAQECVRYMELTRVALARLSEADNLPALKDTIERIRARATYRSGIDTVPLTESLGDVRAATEGGQAAKINVLLDDYWSLAQVLLR